METYLPAGPNWSIAVFVAATKVKPAHFYYLPIIAWEIAGRTAVPIAPSFDVASMVFAIRDPRGGFHHGGHQFDNETDAIAMIEQKEDAP